MATEAAKAVGAACAKHLSRAAMRLAGTSIAVSVTLLRARHVAVSVLAAILGRTWLRWRNGDASNAKVLVLGIDGSGKSTLIRRLNGKMGKLDAGDVQPTVPFVPAAKEFSVRGRGRPIACRTYDLSGRSGWDGGPRRLWREYYSAADAVLFVIDCADRSRWTESIAELERLLEVQELEDVPFLIVCNKMDAVSSHPSRAALELSCALRLDRCMDMRAFRTFLHSQHPRARGSCAVPELPPCILQDLFWRVVQPLSPRAASHRMHVQPCSAFTGDGIEPTSEWLANEIRLRARSRSWLDFIARSLAPNSFEVWATGMLLSAYFMSADIEQ